MKSTINTFEARIREIELFYNSIEVLEIERSCEFNIDFFNILHSNSLLMLYNLVESTVLGGILEIYDAVQFEKLSYKSVSKEIQQIWFTYKFNQVYQKDTSHNSHKDKALEIIDDIFNEKIIELDRHAVNISGNLDADKIRIICDEHGIYFNTPKESNGGYKIKTVKDLRNDLAHGLKSFVEIGRDFSLEDLKKITDEIILFLRGLLNGMKDYYDKKLYQNITQIANK